MTVDVGDGSHFSFDMAKKSEAGVVPHTLGADMHGYNTKVPEPDKAKQDEHLFRHGREVRGDPCHDGVAARRAARRRDSNG